MLQDGNTVEGCVYTVKRHGWNPTQQYVNCITYDKDKGNVDLSNPFLVWLKNDWKKYEFFGEDVAPLDTLGPVAKYVPVEQSWELNMELPCSYKELVTKRLLKRKRKEQ